MNEFITKIFLRNTINAAFQRGKVYSIDNLSEKEKNKIKSDIKVELENLSHFYTNEEISEEQHIRNIKSFSDTISSKHQERLKNGRLRIGTAQKLLNVYIKFLWCLGEAEKPVHCPVDGIVLKEIKDNRNWTELDSIEDYQDIISKIKQHIDVGEKIADWEWELWNRKIK